MHARSSRLTPPTAETPPSSVSQCRSLRHSCLCAAALWLSALCSTLHAAPPKELVSLQQSYAFAVAERVTGPHETALIALNTKYKAGLERTIAEAKAAGKLEAIIALEAEIKRLADKLPIPSSDDETEPESLKKFRGIYRQQLTELTAARDKNQAALLAPYTAKLQELEASLVKSDRVDEAKEVLAYRQGLGTSTPSTPAPTAATTPAAPAPAASIPDVPKVRGDDRKAAEWILANWSDYRIFSETTMIKSREDIPKGKFALTSLSIDGRFYTGKAPLNHAVLMENLGGLSGVKTITFGNFPDLKDEDLAFLGTLPALEELKLSKLSCTDSFLAYLKDLRNLRVLDMSEFKNLTGTGFSHLKGISSLDRITNWKGGMTDEGVAATSKLGSIRHLDCQSSPRVTDACIPDLRLMGKLTTLFIAATGITPEGFGGVPMPKIISLGGNALGRSSLSELAPKLALIFPNTEWFYLTYNASTPEDLAALSHFKKLKGLNNAGTIKDEALPGLLELRELEAFRMYYTEMTPALWQTLAKLKKLKVVYHGNKVPDANALAAFKKERPDVKVAP